jgi:hypothetical protein
LTALLIARDGREFELPLAHLIHFYRGATEHVSYAVIDAPEHAASLFRVSEVEERARWRFGDAVKENTIVRCG